MVITVVVVGSVWLGRFFPSDAPVSPEASALKVCWMAELATLLVRAASASDSGVGVQFNASVPIVGSGILGLLHSETWLVPLPERLKSLTGFLNNQGELDDSRNNSDELHSLLSQHVTASVFER